MGINLNSDEDMAADLEWRSNVRTFDEANYGVDDYA